MCVLGTIVLIHAKCSLVILLELNIHWLNAHYMLAIVIGAGDTLMNRTSKVPILRNLNCVQWVEGGKK